VFQFVPFFLVVKVLVGCLYLRLLRIYLLCAIFFLVHYVYVYGRVAQTVSYTRPSIQNVRRWRTDPSSHNSMEQCLFYSSLPCSVPRRWWLRVVVFSSCKRPRQLHSRKGSRKVVHVRIPTGIVVGQRSFLLLLLVPLLLQVAMQRGSIQA
jgi:hypothetical protein